MSDENLGGWKIDFGDEQIVDLAEQATYRFPHPLQRWVMPLLMWQFLDGAVVGACTMGTAFAIGPNLLVTAKHVVEEYVDLVARNGDADLGLRALLISDEPMPGQDPVWVGGLNVRKIATNPDHDIALLGVNPPIFGGRSPKLSTAPLTVDPPAPGSPVMALGYPGALAGAPIPNTGVTWA